MTADVGTGSPHTNSVVARWGGGWRCTVEAGGFQLVVDEPPSAGGTGTGPMPTEYLLAAMASCYALAVKWAAGKRGITVPGLTVTATGTYDGPRFSRLQLSVSSQLPAGALPSLLGVPTAHPNARRFDLLVVSSTCFVKSTPFFGRVV